MASRWVSAAAFPISKSLDAPPRPYSRRSLLLSGISIFLRSTRAVFKTTVGYEAW